MRVTQKSCSCHLLMENRLRLTTKTLLLSIVSSLSLKYRYQSYNRTDHSMQYLSEVGSLARLILSDFVYSVLATFLALAEGPSLLGDVDHVDRVASSRDLSSDVS